jgi:CBS domain-containing protein
MKASEIMTSHDLWVTGESSDVIEVARMMAEHNVGSIPVLDEMGRLEGIVTDRDICCRIVSQGKSYETPVRDVMTRGVQTVHPDTDIKEVESIMRQRKIRRIPVVDEQMHLKGFIALADLARHIEGRKQAKNVIEVLEDISSD